MFEEIRPPGIVVVETLGAVAGDLWPEEEEALGPAVAKRRREFVAGRSCAREALRLIGVSPQPIPIGHFGEPLWPPKVVGSITHSRHICACAIATASEFAQIGIDAEPNQRLPEGVVSAIAGPEELRQLDELGRTDPDLHWDRLLFSAKEAALKAWLPRMRIPLDPRKIEVSLEVEPRAFSASLPSPSNKSVGPIHGRWRVAEGFVLTLSAAPVPKS